MTSTTSPELNDLGEHPDGYDVVAADLELRGVGGGLRKPLRVDPAAFHQGETVIISYEATIQSVRFDPEDKDEPDGDQVRVHIANATGAIVRRAGKGTVEKEIKKVQDAIARAADADKGVQRLPTSDELAIAHDQGEHADGLVEHCSECDKELELANAGE